MNEEKKYYWLKLKKDFFKRHDIRIIENMPNGKDYVLFYLKLLVESLDHEGKLRFSDTIPYSESMLSTITNTNVDIVRSAIKIFAELQMMTILSDGTLFLMQVNMLTGSETVFAEKKRIYRQSKGLQIIDKNETKKDNVRQEKELEKELEKEKNTRESSSRKPTFFDKDSVPYRLAKLLYEKHSAYNPQFLEDEKKREKSLQDWSVHIELLLRLDRHDSKEIARVIDWCQKDPFWVTNILSGKKLREKYQTLWEQMEAAKKQISKKNIGDIKGQDYSKTGNFRTPQDVANDGI